MTVTDFQDPLFARYDLAVEFDERLKRINAGLLASSVAEGGAKIVQRLDDGLAICALELFADRATLEISPDGCMKGTGEPVYEHVYRIPYQGDPELWHLRPSCPVHFDDPVEGEVRRGKVALAFLVTTAEEAKGLYRTALSQINLVLSAQSSEIDRFNRMLPALIWQKLIHYRTGFSVPEADATRH